MRGGVGEEAPWTVEQVTFALLGLLLRTPYYNVIILRSCTTTSTSITPQPAARTYVLRNTACVLHGINTRRKECSVVPMIRELRSGGKLTAQGGEDSARPLIPRIPAGRDVARVRARIQCVCVWHAASARPPQVLREGAPVLR